MNDQIWNDCPLCNNKMILCNDYKLRIKCSNKAVLINNAYLPEYQAFIRSDGSIMAEFYNLKENFTVHRTFNKTEIVKNDVDIVLRIDESVSIKKILNLINIL